MLASSRCGASDASCPDAESPRADHPAGPGDADRALKKGHACWHPHHGSASKDAAIVTQKLVATAHYEPTSESCRGSLPRHSPPMAPASPHAGAVSLAKVQRYAFSMP